MTRASNKLALRVGLFLTGGLVVAALIIFAIGEKRGLFQRKVTLYAHFDNISGLVAGAPVRLAGLDVGTVAHIEFPSELERKEARIELNIERRYLDRIRHDSRALVDSKGLLGDKIINITLGSSDAPPHVDGDTLTTRAGPTIEDLATQVEEVLTSVTQVSRSADTAIQALTTEQVRSDVGRIVRSTANMLEEVEYGDGLLHRLIYEPSYADDIGATLVHLRGAMARAESTADRADRILAAVESGTGSLHELVYGTTATETLAALRDSSTDLSAILGEVREGDGLVHALIYDAEQLRMLDELGELATRMNRMAGEVEHGRGTIGGLLVDPSVYEDMKTILGNVERNVLLKALMRFTIKEGDIERPAPMATTK